MPTFKVRITGRADIYKPDGTRHSTDEDLERLDGIHVDTIDVSADNADAAVEMAIDQFMKKQRVDRISADDVSSAE